MDEEKNPSGERLNARVQNAITGRSSLRPQQSDALPKLVQAIDAAPSLLSHEPDIAAILATLNAELSTLEDFEREFPSLCFALATGVGKESLQLHGHCRTGGAPLPRNSY